MDNFGTIIVVDFKGFFFQKLKEQLDKKTGKIHNIRVMVNCVTKPIEYLQKTFPHTK